MLKVKNLREEEVFAHFNRNWRQIVRVADNSPMIDGAIRFTMA